MNQNNDMPQLGYFLDYDRHWLQALRLLKYQLKTKIKKKNRHFNTLEMFYYEKFEESFKELESREYFDTRIANNLFYGLQEFTVVPYTIPKSNLGLRRYKFMTLPMRVLYYAVGLYLLKLSEEYLKDYKSHKHIHANYGGNLYFEADKLKLNFNSIYYYWHYQEFDAKVKQQKEGDTRRKVVIRLDIENYYDELNISRLLNLLAERVKPSIQRERHYNETTQAQLVSFFDFVSGGTSGIPQSDNNVISSFIGHLFLVFGDLFFDDELRKHGDSVDSYTIIRYVDDIYISITFKEQNSNLRGARAKIDLRNQFNSLAPRISDCLYENLGLRLNPKTQLFILENEKDKEKLEKSLKKISQGIEIPDEENNEPFADKTKKIFDQLKKLKNSSIAPYFPEPRELDEEEEEVLKGVYDDRVYQMLKQSTNKSRLRRIFMGFGGFNFELVSVSPKPIIILIELAGKEVQGEFKNFLLSKKHLTSRDIYLTLTYLCQTRFAQKVLLKLLKRNLQMKKIMEIFETDSLPPKLMGYYGLKAEQVSKIAEPNVTEQIRLRVLCEQKEEHSVALNHLLNEIDAICRILDEEAKSKRNYGANQVAAFLRKQKVPHGTHAQIRNLFDRRNKSTVSHADPIAWAVTKDEYMNYRSHVGDCLKHLEQIIEEFQPPAWKEVKQRYTKKLESIPCVQEGYIKIDGNNARVVIVLAEESVGIIEQLAEIDWEINLKFRPLYLLCRI